MTPKKSSRAELGQSIVCWCVEDAILVDPTLALKHWLCAGQKAKGLDQVSQGMEYWLEQSLLRGSGSVSSTGEWWTHQDSSTGNP